jgi:hypothetical protein
MDTQINHSCIAAMGWLAGGFAACIGRQCPPGVTPVPERVPEALCGPGGVQRPREREPVRSPGSVVILKAAGIFTTTWEVG